MGIISSGKLFMGLYLTMKTVNLDNIFFKILPINIANSKK